MKPFNVEAAKAGAPVCTRDGRDVRIVCYDAKRELPIVALVSSDSITEVSEDYCADGRYYLSGLSSDNDLFMKPVKREGWVNMMIDSEGCRYVEKKIFNSKDDAEGYMGHWLEYIATIHIEWEE